MLKNVKSLDSLTFGPKIKVFLVFKNLFVNSRKFVLMLKRLLLFLGIFCPSLMVRVMLNTHFVEAIPIIPQNDFKFSYDKQMLRTKQGRSI